MKKLMTVPIDRAAMERLNYDQCIDGDLIDVYCNYNDFMEIWPSGIFDEINRKLNVIIDDFEEEKIIGKVSLTKVMQIVESFLHNYPHNIILLNLKSLIICAIRFDTGIFFFF